MNLIQAATGAIERLPFPDAVTRAGIGALVGRTRRRLAAPSPEAERAFAAGMDAFPIAEHADAANTQHYEVPAAFFERCLGPRASIPAATTTPRVRHWPRPRSARSRSPPSMPPSPTGSRSWSSAAAGAR